MNGEGYYEPYSAIARYGRPLSAMAGPPSKPWPPSKTAWPAMPAWVSEGRAVAGPGKPWLAIAGHGWPAIKTIVGYSCARSSFEVDKKYIVTYALSVLSKEQLIASKYAVEAIKKYNIDQNKPMPTKL